MTTVLIVDEDTSVLRLLDVKLSGAGFEVMRARDGSEALALAQAESPDVVVTEVLLPDIEQPDYLMLLRKTVPNALVLVLSSLHMDETIASALAIGADDFMSKPFSPLALLERLRVNLIRTRQNAIKTAEVS